MAIVEEPVAARGTRGTWEQSLSLVVADRSTLTPVCLDRAPIVNSVGGFLISKNILKLQPLQVVA